MKQLSFTEKLLMGVGAAVIAGAAVAGAVAIYKRREAEKAALEESVAQFVDELPEETQPAAAE